MAGAADVVDMADRFARWLFTLKGHLLRPVFARGPDALPGGPIRDRSVPHGETEIY
jgi:hypothetical protein